MSNQIPLSLNEKVWEIVKKVPKGKVTTYGELARVLGNPRLSRQVGWPFAHAQGKALYARAVGNALHRNTDPSVPCHRVVDRNGRLAPNFGGPSLWSFGRRAPSKPWRSGVFSAKGGPVFGWDGALEQRRRLEVEGVKFVDEMHVDLSKHLWK